MARDVHKQKTKEVRYEKELSVDCPTAPGLTRGTGSNRSEPFSASSQQSADQDYELELQRTEGRQTSHNEDGSKNGSTSTRRVPSGIVHKDGTIQVLR